MDKQRIVHHNHFHEWKVVNKGTTHRTQGSVSGTYLFKVFPNDLEIKQGSTPALFTVKTSQAYPPKIPLMTWLFEKWTWIV